MYISATILLPRSGRSTLTTPAIISGLTKQSPMFKHITIWMGHKTNLISLNKVCTKIKPNPTFYRISLIVINYLNWLNSHLPKNQSYGIIPDTATNLILLNKICTKIKPNPTFYRISLIVNNYLNWLNSHLPQNQSYGIINDTTTNLISLNKICVKRIFLS